jgi:hypothetical protein
MNTPPYSARDVDGHLALLVIYYTTSRNNENRSLGSSTPQLFRFLRSAQNPRENDSTPRFLDEQNLYLDPLIPPTTIPNVLQLSQLETRS